MLIGVALEQASEASEEDVDVFDFLAQLFGFQRDSVRNQRYALITR